MIRVLFLCTGNSARSQMAEGLLRQFGGPAFDVHSAGVLAKGLNPLTIASMQEIGIDVSSQRSKGLERYVEQPWDYVITLCDSAAETCPAFPGPAQRIHWSIPDPAMTTGSEETRLAAFRAARQELSKRVDEFVAIATGMVKS